MYEYKVLRDVSQKNDNDPKALEKQTNELAAEGWRLTSTAVNAQGNTSKIFLFFEREKK